MKKTAKSLKRALALMLAVLMLSSGFAFSGFAENTMTLTATPDNELKTITVVPTPAEGMTIDNITYTVEADPASGAPTKDIIYSENYSAVLQGLVRGTTYKISCIGSYTDASIFTASVTAEITKANQESPYAVYATDITRTSVTVNAIPGAEYTIDDWATKQTSNVFTGLTEGQNYTVKARYPETEDLYKSNDVSCNVVPSRGVSVVNKTVGSLMIYAVSYPTKGIVICPFGKDKLDSLTSEPELPQAKDDSGIYTLYNTADNTEYKVTAVYGEDTVEFTINTLSADAKAEAAAPTGITAEEITATSIKVTKVDGVEYGCVPSSQASTATVTYGSSNEFTGLAENTEYTIYARYAENEDSYASAPATVTASTRNSKVDYAVDTEKNCINITAEFPVSDSVKSVAVDPTTVSGSPVISVVNETKAAGSYKCDIYNIVKGTKYKVTVTLNSGKLLETTILIKADQAAPAAPTLSARTKSSITINSVIGTEYICVPHGEAIPETGWTTATATTLAFETLSDGTIYDIYARLPETETAIVSPASTALSVTTIKASANIQPGDVTFDKVLKTEVDVTKIAGYEYKLYTDGNESTAKWQDSNKFTGLTSGTVYYVEQRVKVDETVQEVNPTSAPKKVVTNTGDPYIITEASLEVFTLSTDNGSYSITAKAVRKSTTDKQWGDIEIIPVSYTVKKGDTIVYENKTFTTTDYKTYTASGSVSDSNPGDYTIVVMYEIRRYQNEGTDGFVTQYFVTQQKTFTVVAKWQYYLQKALSFLGTTLPNYIIKFFNWLRSNSDGISSFITALLSSASTEA